jgi:hypothetical protein
MLAQGPPGTGPTLARSSWREESALVLLTEPLWRDRAEAREQTTLARRIIMGRNSFDGKVFDMSLYLRAVAGFGTHLQ